jgi:GTP-binding protein EngB required for normal cell division
MRASGQELKTNYFLALGFLVHQCRGDADYINARLAQYRSLLAYANEKVYGDVNSVVRSLANSPYCYWLLCDLALILLAKTEVRNAYVHLSEFLAIKQAVLLEKAYSLLWNDDAVPAAFLSAEGLISQFRANRRFIRQPELRIMITGNMSAGKSTIINALVGKPLERTSQEATTGNLSYLYSKPFEDSAIHLLASPIRLGVTYEELAKVDRSRVNYIASSFRTLVQLKSRICIIDTPGADSAINRDHGKLTRKALTEAHYDRLMYIFNANRLGTDAEYKHLKFISENVPRDKVIFVLNKIDDFKKGEDSISKSIDGVRADLIEFGYENPTVCPVSAYFALLLKMRHNGEMLSDDEEDVYNLYARKFNMPEYDLSRHDGGVHSLGNSGGFNKMAANCGLHSLENMLFGGANQ